ncbi:MAG: hypothetical protein KAT17_05965 [Candidatus Aminicenantes bacterium]|nr:hypothetical protein [Candidatus Aminicenantes bacterium]
MRGFLIVLLLALLVIVTIYTGFFSQKESLPQQIINTSNRVDNMLLETDFKHIIQATEAYFLDFGKYPESLEDMIPVYLRTEKECLDPWATKYQILTENQTEVFIISAGKDKIFKTSDDLRRRIQ